LFLGSGSVIHAMSGEQDMRKMGGLRKALPITHATFVIATLAIAGVPGLAGFFSKDAILEQTFAGGHTVLWVVGLATAGLTACYMFRAVFMTFYGRFRGTDEQKHHLHESPPSMTVPLIVLAAGSVLAGYVGMPRAWLHGDSWLQHFLSGSIYSLASHGPVAAHGGGEEAAHAAHHLAASTEWLLMILSVVVALIGILLAWLFYGPGKELTRGEAVAARFPWLHRALVNKWYVDEAYDATVVRGTWATARGLFAFDAKVIDGLVNGSRHFTVFAAAMSGFFDKYVIDRLVNATGWVLSFGSRILRRVQTGFVSQYAFVFVLGVFAMVCLLLFLR
jgi:NADH-quinone oxidoreductase subunit L